jgi:hypothetical protein
MTPMHYDLTVLPNGLRVITEPMPSLRSIAVGCWIDTGTRDERPAEAGASHFLEHLLFKGSDRLSARAIAETFDSIGAESNAFTSKDYTCFWARLLDQDLGTGLDALAEMIQRPAFRAAEIDAERSVVIEEINMNEDDPVRCRLRGVHPGRVRGPPAGAAGPGNPGVDPGYEPDRHRRLLASSLHARIDRDGDGGFGRPRPGRQARGQLLRRVEG